MLNWQRVQWSLICVLGIYSDSRLKNGIERRLLGEIDATVVWRNVDISNCLSLMYYILRRPIAQGLDSALRAA